MKLCLEGHEFFMRSGGAVDNVSKVLGGHHARGQKNWPPELLMDTPENSSVEVATNNLNQ